MLGIEDNAEVYVFSQATDMRCGFDRLSELVKSKAKKSVLKGGLFVFFSRCCRKIKILYWDTDGYAIWHKRLEAGKYRIGSSDRIEILEGTDLKDLLSGMDLSRIRFRKKF